MMVLYCTLRYLYIVLLLTGLFMGLRFTYFLLFVLLTALVTLVLVLSKSIIVNPAEFDYRIFIYNLFITVFTSMPNTLLLVF